MYEKETEQLQKIIDDSSRIVFFGGAGVSTESNIPTASSCSIRKHSMSSTEKR